MDQGTSSDPKPAPPPPPPPASQAEMTDSGHIKRVLPPVRNVEGNKFSKNPHQGAEAISGDEAKKALSEYNETVKQRYDEIKDEFEGWDDKISPINDPEFQNFIRAQLAYANMAYITTGTFPADVRKNPTEELDEEVEAQLGKLSPDLRDHPAAILALQDGADLTGGYEDED